MLRFSFCLTIACFCYASVLHCTGQSVTWSQPLSENSKFPYLKILGAGEDGFYVLRSNISLDHDRDHAGFKSRKYVLQFYTSGLTLVWDQELRASLEDCRISGAELVNGKIFVTSYIHDKTKKVFRFYGQFLNSFGQFENAPVLLNEFQAEDLDEDNKPGIVFSQDASRLAFSFRKYNPVDGEQVFMAAVFDSSLNLMYRKELAVRLSLKRFSPLSSLVTDAGNFFILGIAYRTDKKVKAPGESYFELIAYNRKSERQEELEIRIEDKFLTDVAMSADNQNNKVVVAGFYSDKTTYSTAGIFYYSLHEDSLTPGKVMSSSFPASYIQKFLGERKENKNRELVNYSIDRLILRRDGGAVILAESYYQSNRSYWDYYTQSLISHTYYHFGNIMVLSVNPDGKILWNNTISKDQNSIDDAGYFSSYLPAVSSGKMIAVYNKYIDDDSSVLYTIIDGKGNQKTSVLFNETEKVNLTPRAARQIDEETLLLPAYKQNKFYFISLAF